MRARFKMLVIITCASRMYGSTVQSHFRIDSMNFTMVDKLSVCTRKCHSKCHYFGVDILTKRIVRLNDRHERDHTPFQVLFFWKLTTFETDRHASDDFLSQPLLFQYANFQIYGHVLSLLYIKDHTSRLSDIDMAESVRGSPFTGYVVLKSGRHAGVPGVFLFSFCWMLITLKSTYIS